MHCIIPQLYDCWVDPVAHLLLLKSSMGHHYMCQESLLGVWRVEKENLSQFVAPLMAFSVTRCWNKSSQNLSKYCPKVATADSTYLKISLKVANIWATFVRKFLPSKVAQSSHTYRPYLINAKATETIEPSKFFHPSTSCRANKQKFIHLRHPGIFGSSQNSLCKQPWFDDFGQKTLAYFIRGSITVCLSSCLTGLDLTKLVNLYLIHPKQSS